MSESAPSVQGSRTRASSSDRLFRIDRVAAIRMLRLYDAIKRMNYPNLRRLAEEFEVHARTVQRDIADLRDLVGAPIEYDRRRGGYYCRKDFELPSLKLTEGELAAIFVGFRLLVQYRGTPFEEDIEMALDKISAMFPRHISADLSRLVRFISFDVEPVPGVAEEVSRAFRLINASIESRRKLRITYYSPASNERTIRLIAPYHLRFDDGAWYAIAHCDLRNDIRTFALHRMGEIEETGISFAMPADFTIEDYLGNSWSIMRGAEQEVIIRFDPFAARWVRERTYHPSQRMDEAADGSLLMTFTVSGLDEIKRWILQFGGRAEVVAPEGLRVELSKEAASLQKLYSSFGGDDSK